MLGAGIAVRTEDGFVQLFLAFQLSRTDGYRAATVLGRCLHPLQGLSQQPDVPVLFTDHVVDHHVAVWTTSELVQAVVEDDDGLRPANSVVEDLFSRLMPGGPITTVQVGAVPMRPAMVQGLERT